MCGNSAVKMSLEAKKKKNEGCHQPIDFLGTKGPEQYIFNNGLNRIKKKTQRPKIIVNGSCFGLKDMK